VWSGPSTRSQAARVCSCSGIASATGPWSAAANGLRNITGRGNSNGTVTIWAIISTASGSGDQGADPNKLVEITDPLNAARPATGESFRTMIRTAGFGEVLCGVSFTARIGGRRPGAPSSVAPGTSRVSSMAFRVPGGRKFHLPNGRGARPGPGATRPWPTGGDGAGADGTTAACRW
jgi:hypothetical protein